MSESAEEDGVQVDMESSMYSQVVFIDVPRSYPLKTNVACCYKVTGDLIPSPKDWIGMYKVGWDSVQKYYCYQWANTCLEDKGLEPVTQQITFKDSYLPTDDGEFYQFLYVDSSRKVRGASTPFCFQNPAETSVDCSLLVISTQEQVEQKEREMEAVRTKLELSEEQNTILKKEKEERLCEIHRLTEQVEQKERELEAIQTKFKLSEEHAIIFKNELDERLREIHRLRMYIDDLKSHSTSETFLLKEQPEIPVLDSLEQPFLSQSMAENKPEIESLNSMHGKYENAVMKIKRLKQEKAQLTQENKEKDAEILELRPRAEKAEQDYNRIQDQCQLQQVDMQCVQKENERLHAENEGVKCDLERLQEEIKVFKATLCKQGPPEQDENDTKILSLTTELADVRGALRKEISNSNEAKKRADKAEIQLTEIQLDIDKAARRHAEQANVAEASRLENEKLSEENKKLKDDIEKLQKMVFELSSAANGSNPQQQQNPLSPVPATPNTTQEQPQSDPYFFEDNHGSFGDLNNAGNKTKVCRHCQESFPDITEEELVTHEQSHKVCPFCTLICDDCGQQEFEDHVYSHEE